MDRHFGESDLERERGERDREFIGLRDADCRRDRDRSFLKIGDTERFGERERDREIDRFRGDGDRERDRPRRRDLGGCTKNTRSVLIVKNFYNSSV